jgi:hypothetical protein
MSPFTLQHMPLLADDLPARAVERPAPAPAARRRAIGTGDRSTPAALPAGAPGVLQPAAGLALVLASGLFMAVLAVPAYVAAVRAARAHPDIRGAIAADAAAEDA